MVVQGVQSHSGTELWLHVRVQFANRFKCNSKLALLSLSDLQANTNLQVAFQS